MRAYFARGTRPRGLLMKSMSWTISLCRFAACILEISFASDRRCCRPARRSSRTCGSLFLERADLTILQIENTVGRLNWNGAFRDGADLATQDGFDLSV